MRVLALLCVGLALVAARPDVSHLKKGYNYNKPSNVGSSQNSGFQTQEQFGSGSGSHGGSFAAQPTFNSGSSQGFSSGNQGISSGSNQGFSSGSNQGSSGQGFSSGSNQGISSGSNQGFSSGSNQGSSGQGFSSGSNQGFSSGSNQGLSSGSNQGFSSGSNQGFSSGSNQGLTSGQGFSGNTQQVDRNIQKVFQTNQGGFQGGNQGSNAASRFQSVDTVASGFDTENRFSGNNYQQQQNLEPIITKNFFVHAAPEDRQVVQLRVIQEQARPRKNYNVIFVKTPAGPIFKAPRIQQQVQNEDKTLVYVLSNNQGQAEDIVIPAAAPAIPTKPEVFFIKYKNQQEADFKIKEIQNNYNQGNFNAQANLGTQTRFSDADSGSSNSGSFATQPDQSSFQSTSGSFVQPQQSTFQSGVGLVSGLGTGSGLTSGLGLVSGSGSGGDNVSFSSGSADKGLSISGVSSGLINGGSSKQTISTFETSSGPANSVRFSGSSTGANNELEYLPVN